MAQHLTAIRFISCNIALIISGMFSQISQQLPDTGITFRFRDQMH
jgi:hypothetical protein